MNLATEFVDWLATVPADFAFLLALPFLVAAAGLLADRPKRRDAPSLPAAPPAKAPRSRDAVKLG